MKYKMIQKRLAALSVAAVMTAGQSVVVLADTDGLGEGTNSSGLSSQGGTGGTPDGGTTDGSTPDGSTPDGSTPDGSTPDGGTPDGGIPDGGTPDGGTPDGGTPDGGTPDGGTTDGSTPDGGTPDGGTPDGGTPDGSTPDGGTPDGGTPDGGTPDGGTPDGTAPSGDDISGIISINQIPAPVVVDQEKVAEVINQINKFKNVTIKIGDQSAIEAAETAYEALNEEEKKAVTNYSVLQAARKTLDALLKQQAEQAAAQSVVEAIDTLLETETVTVENRETVAATVKEIKSSYAQLTAAQKKLVPNYYSLLQMDQVAFVVGLIEGLPALDKITMKSTSIKTALSRYGGIKADFQSKVGNYKDLEAARDIFDGLYVEDIEKKLAALPEQAEVKLSDQSKARAVSNAYSTLSATQKARVSKESMAKLEAVETGLIELLMKLIDEIPNPVTLDSKEAIDAASKAKSSFYAALIRKINTTPEYKAKADRLTQAITEYNSLLVQSVEALITQLPEDITLDHQEQIETAKAAYDALTATLKKQVKNADKLTAAIEAYDAAVEAAKAAEAIQAVEEMIGALPQDLTEITLQEYKDKVEAAEAAFGKLEEKYAEQVENREALTAARNKLDQLLADEVSALIQALPGTDAVLTLDDMDAIKAILAAGKAFDGLTEGQKALLEEAQRNKITALVQQVTKLLEVTEEEQKVLDGLLATVSGLPKYVTVANAVAVEETMKDFFQRHSAVENKIKFLFEASSPRTESQLREAYSLAMEYAKKRDVRATPLINYQKQSEFVTTDWDYSKFNYRNPDTWLDLNYTIKAGASGDLVLDLSAFTQAFAEYQEKNDVSLVPADQMRYKINIKNESGLEYRYKEGSFVLGTADTAEIAEAEGIPVMDVKGFDGNLMPLTFLGAVTSSEPMHELIGRNKSTEGAEKLLSLYDILAEKGYYGKDALTQYIIAYYNEQDSAGYGSIKEVLENNAEAQESFAKGMANAQWTVPEKEFYRLMDENPYLSDWVVTPGPKNGEFRFQLKWPEQELAAGLYEHFYSQYLGLAFGQDVEELTTATEAGTTVPQYSVTSYMESGSPLSEAVNGYFSESGILGAQDGNNSKSYDAKMALNPSMGNSFQLYGFSFYNTITLEEIKAVAEHKLIINYYEEGTNKVLYTAYRTDLKEDTYDVSKLVYPTLTVDGVKYSYVSRDGHEVTGAADGDKVINVYYKAESSTPDPDPDPKPKPDPRPDNKPKPDPKPDTETIPEEEVPLAELPEEELTELPEEEVPLAQTVVIFEEETPLSDVPETGDYSHIVEMAAAMGLSLVGLMALRKRKEEDEK